MNKRTAALIVPLGFNCIRLARSGTKVEGIVGIT